MRDPIPLPTFVQTSTVLSVQNTLVLAWGRGGIFCTKSVPAQQFSSPAPMKTPQIFRPLCGSCNKYEHRKVQRLGSNMFILTSTPSYPLFFSFHIPLPLSIRDTMWEELQFKTNENAIPFSHPLPTTSHGITICHDR